MTHNSQSVVVGLFIPISGPAGIWGPSCRACAELAASEINRQGGINGKELKLRFQDSGGSPESVAALAECLISVEHIDAFVGMHTSDVREPLAKVVSGSIPYIYTPLYEGGVQPPGVFCIGETPKQQLLPALSWMNQRYRVKRWYLLGHDYVWPKVIHNNTHEALKGSDQSIVGERYLSFGHNDYAEIIEDIRQSRADIVLVSLVGQDSVVFNRAFGRSGLSQSVLRLSCVIEENMLLGIGEENTTGLFVSSSYFSAINDSVNGIFREKYYQHFSESSPPLNTIGQSVYEGVNFLKTLFEMPADSWMHPPENIPIKGARQSIFHGQGIFLPKIYIAEAHGLNFFIHQQFDL